MFVLPSISSGLKSWLVNRTSINKNSKWKVFKDIQYSGEISTYSPNNFLETNVYKTLKFFS